MCILDCLLVLAIIFYTYKPKIWMGVVTSLHLAGFLLQHETSVMFSFFFIRPRSEGWLDVENFATARRSSHHGALGAINKRPSSVESRQYLQRSTFDGRAWLVYRIAPGVYHCCVLTTARRAGGSPSRGSLCDCRYFSELFLSLTTISRWWELDAYSIVGGARTARIVCG